MPTDLQTFSSGYKGKKKPPPGSESAGFHGDLTIPGYKPKTPTSTTPYSPTEPGHSTQDFAQAFASAPSDSAAVKAEREGRQEAHQAAATRRVERAEARQTRLIDKYVTKAYKAPRQTSSKAASPEPSGIFAKTSQAATKGSAKVAELRSELLSHPAVAKANSEGKVVGAKGLSEITGISPGAKSKSTEPFALKGPLSHPHGPTPGEGNRLARKFPGATRLKEIQTTNEEEGGLSPSGIAAGAGKLYGALSHQQGPNPVGKAVEAEAKNAVEAAKTRIGQEVSGTSFLHPTPTSKELQAVATFAIPSTGGAATRAAEEVGPSAVAKVAGAIEKGKSLKDLPEVLRSIPSALKESPAAIRQAAKETPEAARAAAREAPAYVGRKAAKGTENAFHSIGGLAVLGAAQKGGLNVPGGSVLEGQAKAVAKDPLKVLSSTANLAPGLLTGAFQLPVAAGASVISGSPKPLEGALSEQGAFFKHLADTYGSSDASKIEKATLEEGLLPEVLLAPLAAKGIKHLGGDALKGKVEDLVTSRRQPAVDDAGNVLTHDHGGPIKKGSLRTGEETKLSRAGEQNAHRREETFHAATTNDLTELEYEQRRAPTDKHARKAAGERLPVRKGLGPKGKDTLYERAPDYIPFLERAAIDLSNPDAAKREIAHYAEQFKGLKPAHELGATPEALNARDAVRYFTEHPEKLSDPNLAKAVEEYRAMATGERGLHPLHTSERNRYLGAAVIHDKPLPEQMLPHGARPLTEATDRAGAWEDQHRRGEEAKKLRRQAVRIEREAKRKLEPARRRTLRAVATEAESRGATRVRVNQSDRRILSHDPEYAAALSKYSNARGELRDAQTEYGNFARNSSALYGDDAKAVLARLHKAETDTHAAKDALEDAKSSVRRRAEEAASKQARGEAEAQPVRGDYPKGKAGAARYRKAVEKWKSGRDLAGLERGPKGALSGLEKRAARTLKVQRDEEKVREHIEAERAKAKAKREEATEHEEASRALFRELNPFTRPGAKANPNAERIPYDEALENEFADNMRSFLKERGLNPEPAYVPDSAAILRGTPDQSATGGKKPLEGAPKINEGYVWKNGLSRQGYEHLMQEGILRQVTRAHQFEDWRRFRTERGIKFEDAYQHSGKDWQRAFDQGKLNPRDVALVPKQVVHRLEKTVKGGDPTEYEQALAEAMSARSVNARDAQPGTTYEAFPKAAYDEKVAQSQKSPISPILRRANSITSRTMLSTPSFLGAQVVAETAQAIADVNPGRMLQGLRAYNRLTPEQKLRISGVSGETAKAIFSPEDLRTTLGSYESKPFKDSLSFFRRNVFGRTAKDVVTMKWAGELDRAKGSYLRRGVLTGQAMKDLNGLWARGRKLLGVQTETQKLLDEATKGLHGKAKRDAALAYLADNPRILDRYGKSLNEAMGGWTNMTRTGHFPESYRAAALMFYPFLRMSLQWPLKYAINHPIKATALAYLAAENNFALKEALHGEPSFLNYAQIPVYGVGPNGEGEIINLSRIAPGGNALTEAIQGSGSPLGAIQPVIGAAITGATGQGSFGPIEGGTGAHLKAAGGQILGLSPYLRAVDTLQGQKASGQSEFGILAKRANIAAEPLAALEAKLKGSPGSQLSRALLNPFQPTPKARAADSAKLGRILEALSANSKDKQNKASEKAKVLKMRAASEKAENELNGLYKKYGLSGVNKLSEAEYNYSHPYPGSEGGIYGKKQATESIYGPSSGTGSSIYGNEAAPVIPHETSGVSLSIPKIPGLSSVTADIGSLIGGAKAEAAEPTRESKKPMSPSQAKRTLEAQGASPALAAKGAANPKVRAQLTTLTAEGYGSKTKPKQAPKIPNIEGFEHDDQKEFAQWFSHYTKIPPKLAGEWVKQEGGGYSNGGEAGKNNWLGVGYPAHPTPFSESPYFNGTPKEAAKASAEWLEGKIGGEYDYQAAPSIVGISELAKSGASEEEIRSYIEGPSEWGTGAINTAGTISVNGKTTGEAGGLRVPYAAFGKHVRRDLRAVVKSKGYTDTSSTKPITIRGAHGGTLIREVQGSSGVASVINKNKDPEIAARLLLLSAKTGQPVYVLSGARTPAQSESVGGFPDDPHTKGEAFDIGVGAPTLQSAAAIPESVYESVGLYRPFGTAQGGSSAEDNHVQLLNNGTPATGSYEAGAPAISTSVSGVIPGIGSSAAAIAVTPQTPASRKPAKSKAGKEHGPTASQKLRTVDQLYAGIIPGMGTGTSTAGIPGFSASSVPQVDLAAIGATLAKERERLRPGGVRS